MTAAAVALAAVAVLGLVLVLRSLAKLRRQVAAVDAALNQLRADRIATDGELDRVAALMDRADKISARVESTSRLAYNTFATPVIKALAAGKGTTQAARSLRHRNGKA
jgi:hypothetical protein